MTAPPHHPAVTGLGRAFPPAMEQDEAWRGFFAAHFGGSRAAERVFGAAGVRRRHAVANPVVDDVSGWSTGQRMARYSAEAAPLGKEAVGAALADAGLPASEVGLFAVVSCTGYATPGLDIRLAADLGMPADVQRLVIGHMGCYAALPGLGAVSDFAVARGRPAVMLCVELTTLHLQPATGQVDQIVSHALFGDAAVAVVVQPDGSTGGQPGGRGLRVRDVAAVTDPATADHMTWDVTDLGFRMGLSARVPDVLARHVERTVDGLLARHGLARGDVGGWAVHPGGPRILNTVQRELGLADADLAASRAVLAERGNCSSATVLLVLDELRRTGTTGPVVALAFGPGLTLYAALLDAPAPA